MPCPNFVAKFHLQPPARYADHVEHVGDVDELVRVIANEAQRCRHLGNVRARNIGKGMLIPLSVG